jgi:hypothetical protein
MTADEDYLRRIRDAEAKLKHLDVTEEHGWPACA